MLLQLILAILIGVFAGTFTGLVPGIHINLISVLLLSISTTLLKITSPLVLIIFVITMAITHTFIDYIPSILLGAPDEDSFLSILPGHRLLLQGQAYQGIILTAYGSITALFIIILLTPIFIIILPRVYPLIQKIMPVILILISATLIFSERYKKLWALIIFLLAGFLGIASLNLPIKEPFLPLLTGLFGASNLVISLNKKTKIPRQEIKRLKEIKLSKKSFKKSILGSIIAAPFTAFLPGLGASQAALISHQTIKLNQKEFLFALGSINTIVMGLSFITLYTIQKARTGAALTIQNLVPRLSIQNLMIILITIIFSGIIAFFITVFISKKIALKIHKIDYSKISKLVLVILIIIVFLFTEPLNINAGFLGLLIFTTSTFLGITTIHLGIKRMHLMGCLLIPTILFYIL